MGAAMLFLPLAVMSVVLMLLGIINPKPSLWSWKIRGRKATFLFYSRLFVALYDAHQ